MKLEMYRCPRCGAENNDNIPLNQRGELRAGGCRACYEEDVAHCWERLEHEVGRISKGREMKDGTGIKWDNKRTN